MVEQRIYRLLLVLLVIGLVVLFTLMLTGFGRVTAQAQDGNINADLAHTLKHKPAHLEVVDASSIGGQSTMSGSEYIPSSALRHDGASPAGGFRFWPTAGYIRNNSTSYMCLSGPVYVPNGATLTEFSIYFVDDHATSEIVAVLWRRRQAPAPGDTAELVAGFSFTGIDTPNVWRGYTNFIEPGTETVSNGYGYYIGFCFDPNTGLDQLVYGFRVDYTP
jgi:hypothetical protein